MMGKKEVNQEKSIKSTIIEWVKVWISYYIGICNNFIYKANFSKR